MKDVIKIFLETIFAVAVISAILYGFATTVGCSTSSSYMATCKSVCRGQVQHYQDDSIECKCKEGK